MDNVTHLPRPRAVRPVPEPLGLYVRVGRNDHKALLNLLAAGHLRCFGVVIDAVQLDRHRELREQIIAHRLDAVLDPQTQAAATVGGHTEALGELPWGLDRPHRVSDFVGNDGRQRIAQLGDFAVEHGFTQILGPTQDAGDPWLARDIESAERLRLHLDRNGGAAIPLVYSLAIPYDVFLNGAQRRVTHQPHGHGPGRIDSESPCSRERDERQGGDDTDVVGDDQVVGVDGIAGGERTAPGVVAVTS